MKILSLLKLYNEAQTQNTKQFILNLMKHQAHSYQHVQRSNIVVHAGGYEPYGSKAVRKIKALVFTERSYEDVTTDVQGNLAYYETGTITLLYDVEKKMYAIRICADANNSSQVKYSPSHSCSITYHKDKKEAEREFREICKERNAEEY